MLHDESTIHLYLIQSSDEVETNQNTFVNLLLNSFLFTIINETYQVGKNPEDINSIVWFLLFIKLDLSQAHFIVEQHKKYKEMKKKAKLHDNEFVF